MAQAHALHHFLCRFDPCTYSLIFHLALSKLVLLSQFVAKVRPIQSNRSVVYLDKKVCAFERGVYGLKMGR